MIILGISSFYHDSAACLIRDGKIIAAAQEERFSRIKHDPSFPAKAISFCLSEAGLVVEEIDKVVFYDDPHLKFRRLLSTYWRFFPRSLPLIFQTLPKWLTQKLWWKKSLQTEFRRHFHHKLGREKIANTQHHRSHAASAFFPSPYQEAAVLVMDGVGEYATTSLWKGQDGTLSLVDQIDFPNSLGLLYSVFTYYTGFKVNSGEYKIMGLAPYGEPKYAQKIKEFLINIEDSGMYKMNMKYFSYPYAMEMTNKNFHEAFGGEPKEREGTITQREMDLAASIQVVAEEVALKLAKHVRDVTGCKNLCLAGGVALNCVANGKIIENNIFENVWIQPAAGDAGGALGAALHYWYEVLGRPRQASTGIDDMEGSFLGPTFTDEEIKTELDKVGAIYEHYNDEDEFVAVVAKQLACEKVVGWHEGRMEFGPRALGARSILGDPRSEQMQKTMNLKIKYRESFRPFAPSVLREDLSHYFDLKCDSPYMLVVSQVEQKIKLQMNDQEMQLFGIDKLNIKRSDIPAVTHVDYSARVQTVHSETNPLYHKLISSFKKLTGCSVLVNTSFNVRGEPIVCTPSDSYRCFMRTEMEILAIGNFILRKENQPDFEDGLDWRMEFELD